MIHSFKFGSKLAVSAFAFAILLLGPVASNVFATITNCVPAGSIGWWKGEGTAQDSGATNHGTLVGGVGFEFGRVGRAFTFDGYAGTRVDLGDVPSLRSAAFGTIETWIRRASSSVITLQGSIGGIFGFGDKEQHYLGWGFYLDGTGTPVFNFNGGSYVPNVHITDTNYHHLAVKPVTGGSGTVVYVDGMAYSAPYYLSFPGGFYNRGHAAAIGSLGDFPADAFFGSIDELTVYDHVLSASEIQNIYNAGAVGKCPQAPVILVQVLNQTVPAGDTVVFNVQATGSPGLTYQWSFNGANLAGATDASLTLTNVQLAQAGTYAVQITNLLGTASSAGLLVVNLPNCVVAPANLVSCWRGENSPGDTFLVNNGTLAGNVTFGPGKVGQGFVLDGNSDGILLGSPATLQLQTFTIEAWVKRASTTMATGNGESGGSLLGWDTGGYGFGVYNDGRLNLTKIGGETVSTPAILLDANFHHLAVTKSGSVVMFYLDGVSYAVPAFEPGFSFSGSAAIGARGDLSHSFLGSIDEISFYNRALTAAEIQAIYQAGSAGKCLGLIAPFISTQPLSQNVSDGANVTFSVQPGGSPPFGYQWSVGGVNIPGATNSTLTLLSVQRSQSGQYAVRLTNQAGSTNSAPASLMVLPAGPCLTRMSGLVAWWQADGTATDSVGNFNGILPNGAVFAPGKFGQAFSFTGTDQYVANATPGLTGIQNSYTMEFWAWPTRARASTIETVNGQSDIQNQCWAILPSSENTGLLATGVSVGTNGVSVFESGVFYRDLREYSILVYDAPIIGWTHVAVVYSNHLSSLYLNGALVRVSPYSSSYSSYPSTQFGASYAGLLDEVAIYNRPLSSSEISTLYNDGASVAGKCPLPPIILSQPANQSVPPGSNVTFSVQAAGASVLWYQWNKNGAPVPGGTDASITLTNVQFSQSGNYAVTVSGPGGWTNSTSALLTVTSFPCAASPANLVSLWRAENSAVDEASGNNGTLAGNAAFGAGEVGQGFMFDGNNDGVLLGTPSGLKLQDFSIEAWVKRASQTLTTANGESGGSLLGWDTAGYGFGVYNDGSLNLVKIGFSGVNTSALLVDTNYHHVAVTKSSSNVVFYLDGVPYPAAAFDPGFAFSGVAAIGARGDLSHSFLGSIDELSFYSRALSGSEIQTIYHAGIYGKCSGTPPMLRITKSGQNLLLTWPASSEGFQLQEAGALTFPVTWTNVPAAPVITNNEYIVTLPLNVGPKFYRLSR
jgi:hypothetical protein